ncbi:carbonic anhydrase [Coprinopsis cinerea AmutBmut pab1-1]|nr:carbonic anhydrase [Coprinopsis cinerea AmutBmut pab1-1]
MVRFSLLPRFSLVLATASLVFARPIAFRPHDEDSTPQTELELLSEGNKAFRESVDPELLEKLAHEGQAPPFMFLGCSDSRVSEGTIFDAQPGTLFAHRNVANQFLSTDPNVESALAYATSALNVHHIIVMGHYGCGGVASAIMSRPKGPNIDAAQSAIHNWIEPLRELYASSDRPEIVDLRERLKNHTRIPEPPLHEPGFRALVEENVKSTVRRIADSTIVRNHYARLNKSTSNSNLDSDLDVTSEKTGSPDTSNPYIHAIKPRPKPRPHVLFIHGWVYDIETGKIVDLDVSIGPPGKKIPRVPSLDSVLKSTSTSASSTTTTTTTTMTMTMISPEDDDEDEQVAANRDDAMIPESDRTATTHDDDEKNPHQRPLASPRQAIIPHRPPSISSVSRFLQQLPAIPSLSQSPLPALTQVLRLIQFDLKRLSM